MNEGSDRSLRVTLGDARNTDGTPLRPDRIEATIGYLRSPGSGVDPSSSFEDHVRATMVHDPRSPDGTDHVAYFGVDAVIRERTVHPSRTPAAAATQIDPMIGAGGIGAIVASAKSHVLPRDPDSLGPSGNRVRTVAGLANEVIDDVSNVESRSRPEAHRTYRSAP